MVSYLSFLEILRWTDVLEIALLSGIIYRFCCWLKRDRTSFLLGYFYLACALFLLAFTLNLHAILAFYRAAWPILVLLFIIVHQKSLQQNYIAARTIEPVKSLADTQWIHIMMRAAFKALQRKKNIIFIIQGKQHLEDHITKAIIMHSPISQQMLDMIIESSIIEDQTIVLLNQTGILLAFNGQWLASEAPSVPAEQATLSQQQKHALMWTSKTDALIFFAQEESKRMTIFAQGTVVNNLTNDKAELIISQYIRKQQFTITQQQEKTEKFVQKNI